MATFHTIGKNEVLADASAKDTRQALEKAVGALGATLLVCALPYFVPGLERFRAWSPGDPTPFVRLFRATGSGPLVAEAAGGVSARAALKPKERALLSFVHKKAKAPPARATLPSAPRKSSRVAIAAAEIAGVKVTIEDPQRAMRAFYRALQRTAKREKGAITRISHWGDSATAPDKITAIARVLLQKRFGDAGHGFVLASPATRWYHYAGVHLKHENWRRRRVTHRNAKDGRYGYGGVRAVGRANAFTRLAVSQNRAVGRSIGRFELYYLKGPNQGELTLRVDGKKPSRLSAKAEAWQDAVHTIRVPDGNHRLSLSVRRGVVSLYGVVLERDVPGVVYDNLGLIGLAAKHLQNANPAHFKAQLAFRRPDLMILMVGGNTLARKHWRASRYERTFTATLQRFKKARPQASCLVIPPLDHGEKQRGKVRTVPRLLEMIRIQRKVALAEHCAFYDIFTAMGGEGTMSRWVKTRPRLVLHDYAHVTRHGARILGGLIYKALLRGFADYLSGKQSG